MRSNTHGCGCILLLHAQLSRRYSVELPLGGQGSPSKVISSSPPATPAWQVSAPFPQLNCMAIKQSIEVVNNLASSVA
eukprot:1443289-Amphidinium_carterae.1